MRKKKWITPELVVLVRGMAEVAVLESCKSTIISTGVNVAINQCEGDQVCCNICYEQSAS